MNFSLNHRFDVHDLTRFRHHAHDNGPAVWRLSLAVLIASNALLLFFLFLFDVI